MDFIPASVRTWLYGIVTAAIPLLAIYGILDDTQVPIWIALGAAILGTGTASVYRPTRKQGSPDDTTGQ